MTLSKPTSRPGWLYGPFPSPFSTAISYDNLICVASGIGVTPAISSIVNLAETRVVHLIWMCRDADLVEFYLNQVHFGNDAFQCMELHLLHGQAAARAGRQAQESQGQGVPRPPKPRGAQELAPRATPGGQHRHSQR